MKKNIVYGGLLILLSVYPCVSHAVDAEVSELLNLSLDDIANVKVTSVSKKAESLFQSEAAIYVISNDDIMESGAQTIPEALRLAPGIQVAQVGSSRWSVSSRGFNDQFANKLLVLIDGRSVYNSMYSGVYWDQQDTLLEDIDRIEVIRGPGATLWGANAVNGVINIITKHSSETTGNLLSVVYGDKERGAISARNGAEIEKDKLSYRAYAKYFERDSFEDSSGADANDGWSAGQGGFRFDKKLKGDDSLAIQGDIYTAREDTTLKIATLTSPFSVTQKDDEETAGGNLLVKWDHNFSGGSVGTLQSYYDVMTRSGYPTSSQQVKTFDIEWQHIFNPHKKHEVTWGLGYRNVESEFDKDVTHLFFTPSYRDQHFFNAFIQDKLQLIPDKWNLTIGSKFEHNPFTGYEYQPSVRSSYLISDKQTLWGSVSRAVRIPNRTIDDISFIVAGTPGGYYRLVGNRDAESEELIAYEAGYRIMPTSKTFLDLTLFYNDYDNLSSNGVVSNLVGNSANNGSGRSYGIESVFTWEVTKSWDIDFTQSFLNIQLDRGVESGVNSEGKSPSHQYSLRSSLDLPHNMQLNNQIYYNSALPDFNIRAYTRLDSNIVWKPNKSFSLALVGQNLLDDRHKEFGNFLNEIPKEVGRSVFLKAKLLF